MCQLLTNQKTMFNVLATILIGVVAFFGGLFADRNGNYDNGHNSLQLGLTNFPTSLDSLTNPNPTDSVATVSHSAQHSNANDAIEGLEAKLGIGASTAINNSIFAGTGAGASAFVTWATSTSLSTNSATTSNLLVNASTTLLGTFTFADATGTNATTTNFYATNASSTRLDSTTFYGGSIKSCSGANFLQWATGNFGCNSPSATVSTFSTTSLQNLSTTTISSSELPSSNSLSIMISVPNVVGSGATTTAELIMSFNDDLTAASYATYRIAGASAGGFTDRNGVFVAGGGGDGRFQRYANFDIHNITGMTKGGSFDSFNYGTTTPFVVTTGNIDGEFIWINVSQVTDIKFWWDKPQVFFGTSTQLEIMGY